jgi:hypothetical protein
MTATQSSPAEVPPRSNWKRRTAWILGSLLLLLVVLVALAPRLAARMAPDRIEQAFAERFQGRLEVERLELGWGGRQRVSRATLFDPEGAQVAAADVELPGLWSLIAGRGKRLGKVTVNASADLIADDAGRSNLQRALAPRTPLPAGGPAPEPTEPGVLADISVDLELIVPRLSWSDSRTRRAGAPFVLEDLRGTCVLAPGGMLDLQLAGRIAGGAQDGVQVRANGKNLFEAPSSPQPPHVDVEAKLTELPVALLDQLALQEGLLEDLLGERVTFEVRGQGTPLAGSASLRLSSPRLQLSAGGEIKDGVLLARDDGALEADLRLPREVFARRAGALLPATLVVNPAGEELHARAVIATLAVPLAATLEARAAGREVLGALLDGLELALDVELGDWTVGGPSSTDGAQPLQVTGLGLSANVLGEPGAARGEVKLRGKLPEVENGSLSARALTTDLAAWGKTAGDGTARAELELGLQRLPSHLITSSAAGAALKDVFGPRFDLALTGDVERAGTGAMNARARFDLKSRSKHLAGSFEASMPAGTRAKGLPAIELRGEFNGLDFVHPLLPANVQPVAGLLLGQALTLELRTSAVGEEASQIDLKAKAGSLDLALAGELDTQRFVTREAGLQLELRPSGELLSAYVAPSLPAGADLTLGQAGEPVKLVVKDFEWPLAQPGQEARPLAQTLESARARIELALPALVYRQPPVGGKGQSVAIEIGGLRVVASLAPQKGLVADAKASLAGGAENAIDVHLAIPRPAQFLAEPPVEPELTLAVRCREIPTVLIDALAAQEGMLVDVLGPTIELEVDARLPEQAEGLKIAMRSATAKLDLVSGFDGKLLVAREGQGLQASMPLTPLYTKRIVGSLLPMVVDISKPAESPPAGLNLSNFTLPLDGDLRKLSSDVRLDLNQIAYRLVPGLAEAIAGMGGAQAPGVRTITLAPLDFTIREGLVRHDRLPLEIGAETLVLAGSFDLVTREMDFTTDLPLALLGKGVAAELEKVREYIDPNMRVPLRLTGTPGKPRVSVGKEFLESVVEQAAKGAVKKGLGDLLDRALKKDG